MNRMESWLPATMGLRTALLALRCRPLVAMPLVSTVKIQQHAMPKPIRLSIGLYRLAVESGPDAGLQIGPIGEHTLIGREPWCDLTLTDPVVSAQHCELIIDGNAVLVRDLASTNGTYCGPIRVMEAHVESSLPIRVGNTSIRLIKAGESRSIERPSVDPTQRLIGTAPCMQRLFGMMRRVAVRDLAILLLGETGVGKSAIAQAMHEMSPRRDKPLVEINCAAMPAELVETTLFGHVRGAYTGASRSSVGIFEQANGGSVLLDEIGEMPLALQPKLLRVLETGKVRPVGGEKEVDVDFRLFTATNRNLWADVTQGRFRQDLYFRLAGLELEVPALRERREDIELLALSMIHQNARRLQETTSIPCLVRGLSAGARRKLEMHSWPGNVREMQNVISRAMALCEETDIEPEAILLTGWTDQVDGLGDPGRVFGGEPVDAGPSAGAAASDEVPLETFRDFRERLLDVHGREYFERVLRESGGNVTRAAEIAGISRTYLRAMIKKHGLG